MSIKINETKRIATDIDTSIPDFLKRKKGDNTKPETQDQTPSTPDGDQESNPPAITRDAVMIIGSCPSSIL